MPIFSGISPASTRLNAFPVRRRVLVEGGQICSDCFRILLSRGSIKDDNALAGANPALTLKGLQCPNACGSLRADQNSLVGCPLLHPAANAGFFNGDCAALAFAHG